MESSVSALAFKGSVAESITEAKTKNKILLVYLSGADEDSVLLEKSTWVDQSVTESITKHCVFLHLVQGSIDSIHFSACCILFQWLSPTMSFILVVAILMQILTDPINAIPCISAIGYNGVLLWQNEGYANSEKLLAGIEKAWKDLHFQETAAAVLTAALVSNKSEQSASSTTDASNVLKQSSEGASVSSPSNSRVTERVESRKCSESASSKGVHKSGDKSNDEFSGEPSSRMTNDIQRDYCLDDKRVLVESDNILFSHVKDIECTSKMSSGCNSGFSQSETDAAESNPISLTMQDSGADKECSASKVSGDIHLNIRFPSGTSIQATFSTKDTLDMVKKYVDQNRTDGSGPYFLGIPYPRKLFSEQDMSKELSELGFVGREALIVVPHHTSNMTQQRQSAASTGPASPESVDGSSGRFGFVWKIISYFNPFSYFNGASTSDGQPPHPDSGLWEYRPNPAARNNLSASARPFQNFPSSAGATSSSERAGNKGKKVISEWGGNVHTLNHEDEDAAFRDRNAFWNGNSTQYGGGDEK